MNYIYNNSSDKVRFIEHSEYYKYSLRSCLNCSHSEHCADRKRLDPRLNWLDCGRCGCLKYANGNEAIMNERPKNVNN